MQREVARIVTGLCLLVTTSVIGQTVVSPPDARHFVTFNRAKGTPEQDPTRFEFSATGYEYQVDINGRGLRTGKEPARSFDLRLEKEDSLYRAVDYAPHES